MFEILLNVAKTGSWPQAIEMVLPKRKTPSRLETGPKDDSIGKPTDEVVESDEVATSNLN